MRRITRFTLFFASLLILVALLDNLARTLAGFGGVGVAATMWACFGAVYALLLLEPMVRAALLIRREPDIASIRRVEHIGALAAADSGIQTPRFYVYESDKLDVMVTGMAQGTTVLMSAGAARLDEGLMRAILAHEFGHIRLRHSLVRLAIYGSLLTLAILTSNTPFVVLLANFFALWAMRQMEYAADRHAAGIVGAAEIRAALVHVAEATGDAPVWQALLSAHPTFRDRIGRLS